MLHLFIPRNIQNLFILFVSFWMTPGRFCLSARNTVDLILDLQKYYNSGCVSLIFSKVYSGTLLDEAHLADMIRGLNDRNIFVSTPPTAFITSCRRGRPLHVFLDTSIVAQVLLKVERAITDARWLLLANGSASSAALADQYVPFNCEFVTVGSAEDEEQQEPRDRTGGSLKLTELYHTERGARLRATALALWRKGQGLTPLAPGPALRLRRNNLFGTRLRATVPHAPPFAFVDVDDKGKLSARGFFPEMWLVLGNKMNFSTEWVQARDNTYGTLEEGSRWSGMVGQLMDGEADAAPADLSITVARAEVINFTDPVVTSLMVVFVRRTTHVAGGETRFTRPLGNGVWAAAGGASLLTALALAVAEGSVRSAGALHAPQSFSPSGALFAAFGIFTVQSQALPRPWSCRAAMLTGYLSATTLLAAYSAALVSSLAVRRVLLPFRDFSGLVRAGYALGVENNTSILNYFETSAEPDLQRVYEEAVRPNLESSPNSDSVGLTRVCTQPFYAYAAPMYARSVMSGTSGASTLACDVAVAPDTALRDNLAVGLQPHSPYRFLIDFTLGDLRRSGVLQRLYNTLWPQYIPPASSRSFNDVSFWDIFPVLVLLSIGAACGVGLLIIEHFLRCAQPTPLPWLYLDQIHRTKTLNNKRHEKEIMKWVVREKQTRKENKWLTKVDRLH